MVSLISTMITILFLLVTGMYAGAYKKAIAFTMGAIRKTYDITDEKIHSYYKRDIITLGIKSTFPEVKEMRRSEENNQRISSISYVGICIISISLLILFLNFEFTTGQMITHGILQILPSIGEDNINIYFTSIVFSLLTTGISMVARQWKKGYEYRKAQKIKRIKAIAQRELTESELLEIVTNKVHDKQVKDDMRK